MPKLKMTITFLQLAIAFPVVFDVRMPPQRSSGMKRLRPQS